MVWACVWGGLECIYYPDEASNQISSFPLKSVCVHFSAVTFLK